jgi:hypothetical protein
MAFTFSDADWQRVIDAQDIIAVCFSLHILSLPLILPLGHKPSAAMFLFGDPGYAMACTASHRRATDEMEEEARWSTGL